MQIPYLYHNNHNSQLQMNSEITAYFKYAALVMVRNSHVHRCSFITLNDLGVAALQWEEGMDEDGVAALKVAFRNTLS